MRISQYCVMDYLSTQLDGMDVWSSQTLQDRFDHWTRLVLGGYGGDINHHQYPALQTASEDELMLIAKEFAVAYRARPGCRWLLEYPGADRGLIYRELYLDVGNLVLTNHEIAALHKSRRLTRRNQ